MRADNQTIIIILSLILVIFCISLFYLFAMYVRLRKSRKEKGPSQVDFVVGTFHELVAKLKEKERELKDLKDQAERRADTIEDYNENVLQSVPSGVISMDAHWRVRKVNAAARAMLDIDGSSEDGREMLGRVLGASPAEVERVAQSDGRGVCAYTDHDGRRRWLDYALSALLDSSGHPIGRLFVFSDVTELKALEAQTERRQRLSSLGEMAAGIAHELRNPMGVIEGYARLLSKKVDPAAMPTVEAISIEIKTMNRIIEDFLSFAHPGEPERRVVELAPLVEDCLERTLGLQGGVSVRRNLGAGIYVDADEIQMRLALENIIKNAAEATGHKGTIEVAVIVEGGRAEIVVRDDGHGMDENVMQRIFNPFFTTKAGGTGLGLALAHRIITSHDGSIDVESGPWGTAFTISLPLKPQQA